MKGIAVPWVIGSASALLYVLVKELWLEQAPWWIRMGIAMGCGGVVALAWNLFGGRKAPASP